MKSRRHFKLLVGTVACLAIAPLASAQAASAPEGFIGVATPHLRQATPEQKLSTYAQLAGSGVESVTELFDWAGIERVKGRFDFTYSDQSVEAVAKGGMTLNATIFGTPDWARSKKKAKTSGYKPPRDPAEFAMFAAALAGRYGSAGTFWSENPDVPARPVMIWRIWNEPNLPVYWSTGPNAREYVRLLAASRRAILKADPLAQVLTAGIPNSRIGIPMERFIAQLYKAGGDKHFDGLSINPYGTNPRDLQGAVKRVRRLMDRSRDRRGRIWITEFGWADHGPRGAFTTSHRNQAKWIASTMRFLVRKRAQLRIGGVIYFALQDQAPAGKVFWGLNTGLFRLNGKPKLSWRSFRKEARRARNISGPAPSPALSPLG